MIFDLLKENISSEQTQSFRKDICLKCENYKIFFCSHCGCSINLKIKLKKSKCPINKWGKENAI
jgi:hypothetical protein